MAQFCFAEQKRALFTEACLRGWHQACVDFPRTADPQTIQTTMGTLDELRAEVCCICCITDEFAYRTLVLSAYCAGYNAHAQATERDRFLMATALKPMSKDEGLALVRHGMSSRDGAAIIDQAYSQLCAFMQMLSN